MTSRNWGFCDLYISNKMDLQKLELIEKKGYNTIALNTYIEETNGEPKAKKKKGETREKNDYIPEPVDVPEEIKKISKLNILQRITIEFSESTIVSQKLTQSDNLKKYDIIAVVPKTQAAFQYACASMDIDIISLDSNGKTPYKVNRKLYRQAVERGLFFELLYAPTIKDSTSRQNMITTAHNYYAVGKSKSIIISSGAESIIHLRGVHEVISIGFLFGLNSNDSLESIRSTSWKLILKADGRKHGKHHMVIETTDQNEDVNKTGETMTS